MGRPGGGGGSGGFRGGGGGFGMHSSSGHSSGHSSSGHHMSGSGGRGRPSSHNYNSGGFNGGFGGGYGGPYGGGYGRHGGSFFDTVGRYYMLEKIFGMSGRKPAGTDSSYGGSPPGGKPPVGSAGEVYETRRDPQPPKYPIVRFVIGVILLIAGFFGILSSGGAETAAKIEDAPAYISDCVIDEDAWFDSVSGTGKALKSFYDRTGIQPYIVIKAYDSQFEGMSDEEKDRYAENYFISHGLNENSLLYMYFGEPDDYTIGYMTLIKGKQTELIANSEFTDYFWAVLDAEWERAPSSDSLFEDAFGKTADKVMGKGGVSGFGIFLTVLGIAILASAVIYYHNRLKDYREAQKQAHVQHVLNTDLDSLADELADKYTK